MKRQQRLLTTDEEINEYLKEGRVSIANVDIDTLEKICSINSGEYLKQQYMTIQNDIRENDYITSTRYDIADRWEGLFALHKWCIIGSSIAREGLLAPLQFQFDSNLDKWNPHPGSDRFSLLRPIGLKYVPCQWDLPDYGMKPDFLEYEDIRTAEQLRKYYKNWNTSLVYLAEYSLTDEVSDHDAFMRAFINNARKHARTRGIDNDTSLHRRFEIKNSKSLFIEMEQSTERFMDELIYDNNSITVGPWTWSHDQLIFDKDKIW